MSRKVPKSEAPPTVEEIAQLMMSWTSISMSLSKGRNFSQNLRQISDLGLTMPMFVALNVVAFNGKQTMTSLVEHLALSTSATSHMIQRLVELGLIERRDNPDDRRQKVLVLSDEGGALVGAMMRSRFAELKDSVAPLSASTRMRLHAVMCDVVSELSLHAHDMKAGRAAGCPRGVADEIVAAAESTGDAIADAGDTIAEGAARMGDAIAEGAARVGDVIADKVADTIEQVFNAGVDRVVRRVTGARAARHKREQS